jgi:hypothetical protein
MLRIKEYEINHDGRQYTLSVHRLVTNKTTKVAEIKPVVLGYYSSIASVAKAISDENLAKLIQKETLNSVEELSASIEIAKMMGEL